MLQHLELRKPRIAMLAVYIDKYDFAFEGYRETGRNFMQAIATALSDVIDTQSIALGSTLAEVTAAVKAAEQADADALIVLSHGYVNSLIAADPLCATKLPLIMFNTQDVETLTRQFTTRGMQDNHGMQGVQDLTAVLVRRGRTFGIVTGTVRHEAARAELIDHCIAARAIRAQRGKRIGTFGPVMAGMGDAEVDRGFLQSSLGIESVDLDYAELAAEARNAKQADIDAAIAFDREHFELMPDVTEADHIRSARLYLGLRAIAAREKLSGMTFSFDAVAVAPGVETIPFLGITKLMGEGLSYGGEGDLFTTATGTIAHELGGDFSFTEMYTMDFVNNHILHTHMAELNWRMGRTDRKPRLLRRVFTLADCEPFCSLTLAIQPGPITLVANTFLPDGRLHFIALEADVRDMPPLDAGFDIPNFIVGYNRPIVDVVNEYSRLGGPHHLNMVFGRKARRYQIFCEMLGCAYTRIAN